MNQLELNRERRRQRALERLGTNNPRCVHSAVATIHWPWSFTTSRAAPSMTNDGSRLSQLPSHAERLAEGSSRLRRRSTQRFGAHRTCVARLSRHVRAVGQMAPRTRNQAIRRRHPNLDTTRGG